MAISLILDGAEIDQVLHGQDGPVLRHLIRQGDMIIPEARRNIHRVTDRETRLEDTIVKRFSQTPQGPVMTIVAGGRSVGVDYAFWYHEGNDQDGDRIYPKKPGGVLAWVTSGDRPTDAEGWKEARASGRAVIVKSVAAFKGNPFLRDAMVTVLAIDVV